MPRIPKWLWTLLILVILYLGATHLLELWRRRTVMACVTLALSTIETFQRNHGRLPTRCDVRNGANARCDFKVKNKCIQYWPEEKGFTLANDMGEERYDLYSATTHQWSFNFYENDSAFPSADVRCAGVQSQR
jgi:hypothetical protein